MNDDPHLWLEDVTGDDALAWVRERNEPTLAALSASDRFAELQAAAREILDTDDRIAYVRRRGEYLYNFWRDAEHPKGLWRRTTLDEYRRDRPAWDVLIDVDALAADEDENWVWAGASVNYPDYDRALISLSRGGADATVVREFDLTARSWVIDGFALPEQKSSVGWIDRDTVYVGADFGDQPDGHGSFTSSGYPRTVRRWARGTDLAAAPTVFTGEVSDVAVHAMCDPTPGYERHFVSRSVDFYNSVIYEVRDGELTAIDIPSDAGFGVRHDRMTIHLRSEWTVDGTTHPAGTLLAFDYPSYLAGDRTHRVLFAPDAHTSLQGFTYTRSHLVLETLRDVATRLVFLDIDTDEPVRVDGLPELATIGVLDTDPDHSDEIWLSSSSFTDPPNLLHGTTVDGVAVIKSSPAHYDASQVSASQHFAVSADGTRVPYFVVRRVGSSDGPDGPEGTEGTDSGGPRPTLLYGYGGFENSLTPGYLGIAGRNWIARGGVYVIANIRGGGEYGPRWHTQAQREGRHLVHEDFAAVARDLVDRAVTTPDRLAAQGGSNGGLLMGVMATGYPELFGALVCQVPLLDMRRYHLLLAGASWMAEYGDPDDPEQWAFISEYSPYQRLTAEVQPPAMLVTTSTRDDRVHPGHARKFVARMTELGHPVHYYENIEGGHGGAADNAQAAFKSALAYEFLWQTVGAGTA
ncbi:prolyl oligopeptidase family serine peptidase [Gordonia shandongensis]|uniref:prolyl oligopeptidase family serine peptidase n=1 Tax=Gordonia shandongensis TaxID=376351 RepID=UPI0003F8943C|nr:prolyl oligopeptidase family serine peptidase [Gordonia shandongensis]